MPSPPACIPTAVNPRTSALSLPVLARPPGWNGAQLAVRTGRD